MKILITGGCGFVGSNLALELKKKYNSYEITCMDNLKRRGSELSINRLKAHGIHFMHGDIRIKSDFDSIKEVDLIIEAAAEPSVMAGLGGGIDYLVDTNLNGTINCLNLASKKHARIIFLSTSRVYPIHLLEQARFVESATRFDFLEEQDVSGLSADGVAEDLPLEGSRSLYGATKLASELMIREFNALWNVPAVVNRCGVITGPYQMGKVDQGVVVLWAARHFWKRSLQYIGYGGSGKQVRDILHVHDLFRLVDWQIHNFEKVDGQTYNVGGGRECSVSLQELTTLCEKYTGNTINIQPNIQPRVADLRIYVTDNSKVTSQTGWRPKKTTDDILKEVIEWISINEDQLKPILD